MGSHICRKLVACNHRVRIFDKLYASQSLIEDFGSKVEVIQGDMARPEDVINAIADANIVIHLVHTTVPGSSMIDPGYDLDSNVVSTVNWLRRVSETEVKKIIYCSSGGTVYGIPQAIPIDENHPTDPISSYGITKLAIEKYTMMYSLIAGIDYCLVRPSNVYGPGQRLKIGQGLVGVLAERALRGEPLEIWGSGEVRRDYLYVDDLVSATVALVNYTGGQNIFNVSSGESHSVLEIIDMIRIQLGGIPEIRFLPARGYDVPVSILDSSRLMNETAWHPTVKLETGVARTIEWLKTQAPVI